MRGAAQCRRSLRGAAVAAAAALPVPGRGVLQLFAIARDAMQQLGHGDPQLGGSVINGWITQQSYQISFNEVFHALGWIFIGLMLVIWLARPPFTPKARQPAGGH